MTLKEVMELRKLASIAHHVPGRIRLKLDPRIIQHPAAKYLSSLKEARPETGLISTRLNIFARSLVVEYDTAIVKPEEITTFLEGEPGEAEALARKTATLLNLPLEG